MKTPTSTAPWWWRSSEGGRSLSACSPPLCLAFESCPMLTRQFRFLDPARIEPDLARRLRALAGDCERLALGRPVSPILLAKAPLLEDWVPTVTALGVQLVGRVTGHPLQGDRKIATSPVWFADPDGTLGAHPVPLLSAGPAPSPRCPPRHEELIMTHDPAREAETDGTVQGIATATAGAIAGDNAATRPGSMPETRIQLTHHHHRTDTVTDPQIICTNCGTEIKLTESLAAPIVAAAQAVRGAARGQGGRFRPPRSPPHANCRTTSPRRRETIDEQVAAKMTRTRRHR